MFRALAWVVRGVGPSAGENHCRGEGDAVRELESMARAAEDREKAADPDGWQSVLLAVLCLVVSAAIGFVLGLGWA